MVFSVPGNRNLLNPSPASMLAWAWSALLTHNLSQLKYFQMQCIKGGSTLRVSSEKDKPMLGVVFHYGRQNNQIREFLEFRTLIKFFVKRLQNEKETKQTFSYWNINGRYGLMNP